MFFLLNWNRNLKNGKDLQQDQKVQLNDPNQKTSHRYNCFLKQQNFMLNSLFTIYVNWFVIMSADKCRGVGGKIMHELKIFFIKIGLLE
jgi:hypothetical protein